MTALLIGVVVLFTLIWESGVRNRAWRTQDCISFVILYALCISYTTVLCHDSIV